ncbi:ABC-F family ATP-binding cassette domain-containing protein [Caldibacillus lycopersici]|uniref:ABC-F family ATP-binding cassette domain-containing protein n=1 Tax=Perspicuibacillus lycopersici TaxID=1325689 RepID=A0AAE3ISL1_9BACI|nr:ABC-F family ATP-binding cassette domain-containing protein [Perspicuibacillus lycopersici]MCU9613642.1 ABC-F family ATP-binding cassette domain-containing protein [Perspicuibacillus lycopersici]
MQLLNALNIQKSIGEKHLFNNISFSVGEKERIGLIGVNGTGKSTLLKIIAGMEDMDEGSIVKPNDFSIAILLQEPFFQEDLTILEQVLGADNKVNKVVRSYEIALEALNENPKSEKRQQTFFQLQKEMDSLGGWDISAKAKTMLSKLGLQNYHEKVSNLSGGQKKRVALAEVLMHEADLLILDEPTNHLDYEMIEWLQDELKKYTKSILFVTHDRYFLDAVSNQIFELFNGELFTYKGNYANYLEAKAIRLEESDRRREKAENLYKRELAWIRRGAQARSTKQKARIQRFESLDKELQKGTNKDNLEMAFTTTRLGKDVIEIKAANKAFSGKIILREFDLLVNQKDRIGIVGKNGSGKSTLLNIFAGKEQLDAGDVIIGQTVKMAYYTQESVDMDINKRMIEYIKESKENITTTDGKIISAAQMLERFLFPMHTHGTPIRKLSGGERRRLYLLKLLMDEPNVLLLDEPTNDLDTETLTILEGFLEEFAGVVITVSHDRYFLDKVCDTLLVFQGEGVIERYYGSYSDYLEKSKLELRKEEVKEIVKQADKQVKPAKKRLSYMEKREWDEIDDKIAEAEGKIASIQEEMQATGSDFTKLQSLMAEEEKWNQELERLIERWTYLSEMAES